MTSCTCPAGSLASLRFADGLVLLRCSSHETQTWFVDGRPATRDEVLPALKDLFTHRRGDRNPIRRTTSPARVIRMAAPTLPKGGDDSTRLTALLHARGLSGSWAVA